ncbi:MAG: lysylphosphatidylglycerol synthase transmembrane domain-containing protein [archaeon]
MKKKIFLSLSIIAGIVALWIIFKAIPYGDILDAFSSANIKSILGFVAVSVALISTLTWRWKIVLNSQKVNVPFHNVMAYRFIGYSISYLTPSAKLGGEPVRAGLLTRHGVKFSKALSSIIIDKTIDFATSALFFFIGALTVLFQIALPKETSIIMMTFAVIFLSTMIFVYQRLASGKGFIKKLIWGLKLDRFKKIRKSERKIESFEKLVIKFFKKDKTYFLLATGVSLLAWILMFLEYKFAGLILGINLSFLMIFLIVSFVGVAILIPVPMAIGALEASQIGVFSIFDMKNAMGVALALIIRARDLAWTLIGLILLSYHGLKISTTIKKDINYVK